MSATNSQLQLETYFLKELSYSLADDLADIPESIAEINPVSLKISDLTNQIEDGQPKWRCELTVESAETEREKLSFYKFKIVMVGFFQVNPMLSPDEAKTLAESNCPAVLYSTSREIIATITRRSPYPAVLLPLVTFVKFAESLNELDTSAKAPKVTKARKKPKTKDI
jgi:preprotein translocase subunit SecB